MRIKDRIKRVQKHLKIASDGIAGQQTWGAIEKALGVGELALPKPSVNLDPRSEKNIKTLNPKIQDVFRNFLLEIKIEAAKYGCEYKFICGTRTIAEQNALYAKGRTAPGSVVTKVRGGYSRHNFGIAADGAVFKDGKYLDSSDPSLATKIHKIAGRIAKKYNLKWGGDWRWKDYPHFEYNVGLSMSQLRAKVKAGKAIV